MKNIFLIVAVVFSSFHIYSQHKADTSYTNEGIHIEQRLNYSTLIVKHIYNKKKEVTYTKNQINDSIFYTQNTAEGKQRVKLIHFELVDSIWVELYSVTFIDGILISIRDWDKIGNGSVRQFSENGNVLSISEVVDFKSNGNHFRFHSNGLLKEKGSFKDYLKTGEWIYFDENGDTSAIENYVVVKVFQLDLENYTPDELNSLQWGGTLDNELVSLRHGVFTSFFNNKSVNSYIYEYGKLRE